MPSWKKCVFGCKDNCPLFGLPKNETVRQKWLDFFFGNDPPPKKICFVCARHFTEDSFLNKSSFDSGLLSKLSLKGSAVPTLKRTPSEPAPRPPAAAATSSTSHHSAHRPTTRAVATQLSAGTLGREHCMNKDIQASVDTVSRGTGTEHPVLLFSSTHVKPTSGIGARPSKRPHLELEKDDDWSVSIPASQDSTHEPGDTVTDRPELSEMESSSELDNEKYIVFESALRELFDNCPVCRRRCLVEKRRCGTFVSFNQGCPHCLFTRKWQSQPMKGKTPQADLELSAAVYFNGGSFTKIERICNTMNLKIHQYESFKRHAQNLLEPAIYHKWKVDQSKVFEEMKCKGKVAVSGDMRADSPGRSAKFGSYTIMENEDKRILDVQLVQSSDLGSSVNMEKEGLKRSLDLLESNSVQLDYIVTDRHPQVQKHLREREIPHYCGVWHVVKGLSKRLRALAKQKDCGMVQKWLPGIKNHMYWTACSSKSGSEKVAKWTSLVNHIQSVHEHENPLFPQCEHRIKASRDRNKWFKPGTVALSKVQKMLLNKRILKDVHKLSSNHQTSALESFHRLISNFTPKNVNYPFIGMLCRLYLSAMHHNEMATAKGKPLWKLVLPKSTKGRASARLIKTDATFAYRRDLMQLVFNEVLCDPKKFQKELQKVPVPPTLSSMLDSSFKEDAVAAQVSVYPSSGTKSTGRKPT